MKSGVNIVLIGPAGSGKGTQAELIGNYLKLKRVTIGDVIRSEINSNSDLGKKIKNAINSGKLLPSSVALLFVKRSIKGRTTGFVFDGFPRLLNEAKDLDKILKVSFVFILSISNSIVIKRLNDRRLCKCGADYNLLTSKPKKDNLCDVCRSKLYKRDDDNPASIKKRLEIYKHDTLPVVEYYKKKGIAHIIDASKPVRTVFSEIKKVLNNAIGDEL